MGTIGPLAVVTGFCLNSSHVAAAPIIIQEACTMEHGPRVLAHGSRNMGQESVRNVAIIRQKDSIRVLTDK
tara:strand:+ start:126 stop:338 length:213 start_codon:yes stop_codon:yes gene_type:complete